MLLRHVLLVESGVMEVDLKVLGVVLLVFRYSVTTQKFFFEGVHLPIEEFSVICVFPTIEV